MSRICLECRDTIHGRSDKKFCSDNCRSAYNNRINSEGINLRRRINRILCKNRNIIARLNPEGKRTLHKTVLIEEGFNFNYFTNSYKTQKGTIYHFCYDQGYIIQEDGYYTLVERKAYIN